MTEVTPVGRAWRVSMYALCVVMVLSGPGFLALGILLDADLWAVILIAVVLSLILVPLGYAMGSDIRRTARGMRRLDVAGVAGTAEVLSVTHTTYEDRTRIELNLSISAPGVEPFEALHTRDGSDDLEVGTTLGVVVDPCDRFYAVS
ncbi:hypothetical protein [Aeromicrobium sp. 9AM]|uniref:hypothetical protein n=1 Tax=Aeromicrobium sp. 9AM TaxID=2653126 RepID=UPI0012F42204|nr:hypothetical protein [Aeromicrobium sp. 9AM]VXC38013.1 conserved hypothetical protein [Aeromicrobium sp. 9AM]